MLKHKWMRSCLSGWKLVVSDVFRSEPDCSKLLCVLVGDRWCSNYRDGGSYYCLFSPWFHIASFNRDAAGRDDSAVSFSRHCGGLCCKIFVENHRRSFSKEWRSINFLVQNIYKNNCYHSTKQPREFQNSQWYSGFPIKNQAYNYMQERKVVARDIIIIIIIYKLWIFYFLFLYLFF